MAARVGIHTGEVLSGNIGSPQHMKFGVVGDTVNLASRLEGVCKVYKVPIIISEDTYLALTDVPEYVHTCYRRLDFVAVKGRTGGTWIYEVSLKVQPAEARVELQKFKVYDVGLELYLDRKLRRCLKYMRAAAKQYPDDHPTQLLLERVSDSMAGDGWDDVRRLETK